jgi:hypothetical protein
MKRNYILLLAIVTFPFTNLFAQCAQTANIYAFTYNGHTYEVVKELKNWLDAKACADERGGYLVYINDDAEKNYIMGQLMMSSAANIPANYHPVIDGGGASYVWTGGTDRITEGTWYWEGSELMSPFYIGQGTAGTGGGSAVNGAYVNWGNVNGSEPDNFFYIHDQDALGVAMGSWPHGVAGQWNDIDMNNTLYFIIEKASGVGIIDHKKQGSQFKIYPNPASGFILLNGLPEGNKTVEISIASIDGKIVMDPCLMSANDNKIDITAFPTGTYIVTIKSASSIFKAQFVKQ